MVDVPKIMCFCGPKSLKQVDGKDVPRYMSGMFQVGEILRWGDAPDILLKRIQ